MKDFCVDAFAFVVTLGSLKVMLNGTIRNDDFLCNTAMQYWNNVANIRNNVTTMMPRRVALKMVVANCLV